MVKSNIPIYIYYFFKNPIVFYNTIINPDFWNYSFGACER